MYEAPPDSNSVATTLHEMQCEIAAVSTAPFAVDSLEYFQETFRADGRLSAELRDELVDKLFTLANSAVKNGVGQGQNPVSKHSFTEQVCRAAKEPDKPRLPIATALFRDSCLLAEVHLARSLSYLEQGVRPSGTLLPPAVMFDTDGQPCGFQKANGAKSVFVWRRAELASQAGKRIIPAGCFVGLEYFDEIIGDIRSYKSDTSSPVISLHNTPVPQEVNFLRFSTIALDQPGIVEAAHRNFIELRSDRRRVLDLLRYVPEVSHLTAEKIGAQVCSYL